MIRRPPRSTQSRSSAASDVYKRQDSFVSTNQNTEIDSINSYFECITECSIVDGHQECITRCLEVHLKGGDQNE